MAARAKTLSISALAMLALAATLALAACSAPAAPNGASSEAGDSNASASASATSAYSKITADQAQTLINKGDAVIVDVRTPQEYAEKHLPGAINIPLDTIGSTKPDKLDSTDAQLIVYCRTGVRSKQASDQLVALGFQRVNDMGGIVDWNGETVSGSQPDGK